MYNILKISADILIQLKGDTILNIHSFYIGVIDPLQDVHEFSYNICIPQYICI